jgi:hypothetical protein
LRSFRISREDMGFSFRVRPAAEADWAASMVSSRADSRTEEIRESDSMAEEEEEGSGEGGGAGRWDVG